MIEPIQATHLEQEASAVIERRATVRHPCHLKSTCHPLSADQKAEWPGLVVNISQGGVGLVVDEPFKAKSVLIIGLESRDGRLKKSMLARVVHCRKQSSGQWLIGCAFTEGLTEGDLASLL